MPVAGAAAVTRIGSPLTLLVLQPDEQMIGGDSGAGVVNVYGHLVAVIMGHKRSS